MKFLLLLVPMIAILGTGCAQKTSDKTIPTERAQISPLQQTEVQDGPAAIAVDAATGRRFVSVLPPVFIDGNGRYTTQTEGERITTQLSVGGTVAEDENLFRDLPDLESFEKMNLGDWIVLTAYEKESGRSVARATQQDAYDERLYHVIECVGAPKSGKAFWDGCRTMVERAQVTQSTVAP
ncbi:MAG: hypothetical protein WC787_00765 [Patescibacteria group bacterium]|jgi:hypothetical protein